jgi:UDP-N-acetylmuramoyl-L-alanyl-D-glutamate--2,6-diaminopimelate ligase
MTLAELLSDSLDGSALHPALAGEEVLGLDYDSRRVQPGWLFFAFPGARTDGARFAPMALERGAVAVISESGRPEGFTGPWIQVSHGRRTLALAARRFYRRAESLTITGITGTNGKTTTSYLIDSVFRSAGYTTGLIGTIGYVIAGQPQAGANTTPESLDLYRLFDGLAASGGTQVSMEVSSHALDLGRVHGVRFHTAVFTNLTQDHLDYHGSMDEYFRAKMRLFGGSRELTPDHAVVNLDDGYGRQIRLQPGTRAWWYGRSACSAVRADRVAQSFEGLQMDVIHDRGILSIRSSLTGSFNVYNLLAACATGLAHRIDPGNIEAGIAGCAAVPGRYERVDAGQPFLVIVDYAHTPDALRKALEVARAMNPKRLIAVFGCGGDRDRTKRPIMGEIAASLADSVIITSDNPRTEDPDAIIAQILEGVRRQAARHQVEPDRERAIDEAVGQAEAGDIVVIAGKGHETYQQLLDRTIHFDDREVARQALARRGWGGGQ